MTNTIQEQIRTSIDELDPKNENQVHNFNNLVSESKESTIDLSFIDLSDVNKIRILLAALSNNDLISELNLRNTCIDDESTKYIAQMKNLTSLDISENDYTHLSNNTTNTITNKGAQYIAQMKNLTSLDISYSGIDDNGINYFANNTKIKHMNCENVLSTAKSLKSFLNNTRLTSCSIILNYSSFDTQDEKNNFIKLFYDKNEEKPDITLNASSFHYATSTKVERLVNSMLERNKLWASKECTTDRQVILGDLMGNFAEQQGVGTNIGRDIGKVVESFLRPEDVYNPDLKELSKTESKSHQYWKDRINKENFQEPPSKRQKIRH